MSILRKGDGLVFLYKLINGSVDSSSATHTALAAGLPVLTIQRSIEVFNNVKAGRRMRRQDMSEEDYQNNFQK